MTSTSQPTAVRTVFHLEIGDDLTLALPLELREQLELEAGDVVAISVFGGHGSIYKVPKARATEPVVTEPIPEAMGLLRDYFTDSDDVRRFLDEERGKVEG